MTDLQTIEKLENRLTRLVDGMLMRKSDQADFLIGLNRLDDILIDHHQGRPITDRVRRFLEDYRSWREEKRLSAGQKKKIGPFLMDLRQGLIGKGDADSEKLAEEIKNWLRDINGGTFRITLKRPSEQPSLAEKFRMLLKRENAELDMLLAGHDHLLTALDDVLKSAEAKTDPTYRHLAASIIYYLQTEGYKVDPYIQRLRRLKT